jgi:hypothetical protein
MNLFSIACSSLSAIGGVYVGVPYVLSILSGKTKPHQFTWIIFSLVNGIIVVSQYIAGARLSDLIYLAFFIESLSYVALSFKYGVRNTSKYDLALFSLALLTIILWITTRNNLIAIFLSIAIDTLATTMLILKVHRYPGSEPLWLWGIGTISVTFNCLSLLVHPLGVIYIRPLYSFISDLAVVAAIYAFRPKSGKIIKPQATFPEV